jgi:putative ABC transport system permease protein
VNALYLAVAYLRHYWRRSLVLALVAAVIMAVPVVSQMLLARAERSLTDRAFDTPMVLGSRGSKTDLVMNAVYFADEAAEPLTMAATEGVWDSGLALPIPLNTAFETDGARIVGTTLDYFEFRGLEAKQGRIFALLGEAVLGSAVSARLGLAQGDTLISAPQNLFDLAGVYPLEMDIVGVLSPSGSPDDEAVFVDIKTAWVIAGIGHGHDNVLAVDATAQDVQAAASLVEFNRITPENIDSFHFHGNPESYPVTAVLIAPFDDRSATILRGRYLEAENPVQMVMPPQVVGGLIDRLFRIKGVLDAVLVVVGLAVLAAVGLAIFLTYRLRAREMATAYRIGARRSMIGRLLAAETFILLVAAGVLSAMIVVGALAWGDAIVTWLLMT